MSRPSYTQPTKVLAQARIVNACAETTPRPFRARTMEAAIRDAIEAIKDHRRVTGHEDCGRVAPVGYVVNCSICRSPVGDDAEAVAPPHKQRRGIWENFEAARIAAQRHKSTRGHQQGVDMQSDLRSKKERLGDLVDQALGSTHG